MSKFCGKCGAENIDQDSFCVKCGYGLDKNFKTNQDYIEEFKQSGRSIQYIPNNDKGLPEGTSLENAKNLGKVFGFISMIVCLLVLFLWKFDVKVTESTFTDITISHEKMSLIDLISIQPGSILGLVVILFVIFAILSIINPMIGCFSSIILLFGGLFGASVYGVTKDGIIDFTYKVADYGTNPMIQFLIPCLIIFAICFILYLIPWMLCKKDPEFKNKDSTLAFWK